MATSWATLLVGGFILSLPEIVGFAAARFGRWPPVIAWPLASGGTVALYGVIVMAREAENARAGGPYHCGEIYVCLFFFLCAHVVVGGILGALYQSSRRFPLSGKR